MDNDRFYDLVSESYSELEGNTTDIPGRDGHFRVLDMPLTGIADADDPIFEKFIDPDVIGPDFRKPRDYMPDGRSVIALFFPFSEEVRSLVRQDGGLTSPAWNAAYGGNFKIVDAFLDILTAKLEREGVGVFQPNRDPGMVRNPIPVDGGEDVHYSVSWSNRHALYAAGLGTFGRHRHIITEKGCCGTTASFITDAELAPTERSYTQVYEWCSGCGACSERCPGGAIPQDGLRNLKRCSAHAGAVREEYGGFCGKCLTCVPCEDRAPGKE